MKREKFFEFKKGGKGSDKSIGHPKKKGKIK